MKNKQILNILHKLDTINKVGVPVFAYDKESSLFDVYLNEYLPVRLISMESYSLPGVGICGLISNRPMEMAQATNSLYKLFDAEPRFILYHDNTPIGMKKEDKQLMGNSLSLYRNVSFTSNIDWPVRNMSYMTYGIPEDILENNTVIEQKNKDVCILNFNQNQTSNIIYNQLKNQNIEVEQLTDLTFSMSDYISIISEYKIVIDVYSVFNILIALLCGCCVISGMNSFEKELIISNNNITELIKQTQINLKSIDINKNKKNIEILFNKYKNNNFITNLNNLLTKDNIQ